MRKSGGLKDGAKEFSPRFLCLVALKWKML